jgi:hypothetical protein
MTGIESRVVEKWRKILPLPEKIRGRTEKMGLQICGEGRKSKKVPAGCGQETKWEISSQMRNVGGNRFDRSMGCILRSGSQPDDRVPTSERPGENDATIRFKGSCGV